MLKSIQETRKLFIIEDLAGGQVSIKTSDYLLSLTEKEQIAVLSSQLANLKKDREKLKNPAFRDFIGKGGDIEETQLQLLIDIIESLLSQI
jgi:hypothetical protein